METEYSIARKRVMKHSDAILSLLKKGHWANGGYTYKEILEKLGIEYTKSTGKVVSDFAIANGFRRNRYTHKVRNNASEIEREIPAPKLPDNPINTALSKVQEAAIAVKALDNEALKASFVSIFTALI